MLCGVVYIAINIDFFIFFLALYIFLNLTTICMVVAYFLGYGCVGAGVG